ncbi:MAG TPA: hypothetical protein DCE18_18925 [Syntrophobacteraceae bacterium]|nr:hypothetical protein [Syntrophobacteraceae bacterium]
MPKAIKEANRIIGAIQDVGNGATQAIKSREPYRVSVTIQGTCDLLFHRYDCEAVEEKGRSKKGSKERKTDDIETFVWRNEKGEIGLPGNYLRAAICKAAKFQQDPRSPRKSAEDIFKAGIHSMTAVASLGTTAWDCVDKQRVLVQRNAVPRCRPCFKTGWKATIVLMCVLPEYISPDFLHEVITNAGKLVGVGDYRPSYGRFNVTEFKVLDD